MEKQFNINYYFKVKLTEKGKQIYKGYYNKEPKTDSDGYYREHAWVIMQVFGPHIEMGIDNCFDPNILIVFDKEQGGK